MIMKLFSKKDFKIVQQEAKKLGLTVRKRKNAEDKNAFDEFDIFEVIKISDDNTGAIRS